MSHPENPKADADLLVKEFGPGVLANAELAVIPNTATNRENDADPHGLLVLRAAVDQAAAAADRTGRFNVIVTLYRDLPLLERMASAEDATAQLIEGELVRLAGLKGLGDQAEKLSAKLKSLRRAAELGLRRGDRPGAGDIDIPGAPEGLTVPAGWRIAQDGIIAVRETEGGGTKEQRVTHGVILISARVRDVHLTDQQLEVQWTGSRPGHWRKAIVPRVELVDPRALLRLARLGAPVHAVNAKALVSWFSDFEAANSETLATAYSSRKMGWVGHSFTKFLAGRTIIKHEKDAIDVRLVAEDGLAQLADAVATHGTLDGWTNAVGVLSKYPAAYLAIYATVAPVLLGVIQDAPNFIVDWSGDSGKGKTTSLQIAASVWGKPDERGGYIRSWAASITGIERTAELLNYLPTILDESNKVPEHERRALGSAIYMMANGSGKVRGTIEGLQRVASWYTVGISSGETPLTAYTQDEGTRARVISITGAPLGLGNAELADALKAALQEHYGHLGPAVVRWLVDNKTLWPELERRYHGFVALWRAKATNDMAARQAQNVGLLHLAAYLLHTCLPTPLPPPARDPLGLAWDAVESATEDADRGRAALRLAYSWAATAPSTFWGRHEFYQEPGGFTGRPKPPSGGWRGAWPKGDSWTRLGFFYEPLRRHLSDAGFEPESVLTKWKDRGWLKTSKSATGTGRTYQMVVDDVPVRLIVVTREAFEAAKVFDAVGQQALLQGEQRDA